MSQTDRQTTVQWHRANCFTNGRSKTVHCGCDGSS